MTYTVKMTREQVSKLNELAQTNMEAAQLALDIVNSVLGTDYIFFCRRVSFFEDSGRRFHDGIHDAYAWAV